MDDYVTTRTLNVNGLIEKKCPEQGNARETIVK